jgi:hypothetical protein
MTQLWSLATALGRSTWNLQWRFHPAKPLLWRGLLALGLSLLALFRLGGRLEMGSPLLPLLTACLQTGLFALVTAFQHGRSDLFGQRHAALLHLSPAPTWAILGARVVATAPGRALSAAVLSYLMLQILPVAQPLLWGPLIGLTALLSGLLGQLAGYFGLLAWARLSPRAVGIASLLSLLMAIFLVWGLIYLLALGAPLVGLVEAIQRLAGLLTAGLGLLILLPGAMLGLLLLLHPAAVGDLYRTAFLAVAEAGDATIGPQRSWLPRPVHHPLWAIAMKEWRQFSRNAFNGFRLGALLLIWAGMLWARWNGLVTPPAPYASLIALVAGAGGAWLLFGEVAGALFSADGQQAERYAIAGVRPGHLLGGKLLGALYYPLTALLSSAVAAWAIGLPLSSLLGLALQSGLIALGALAVIIGGAALSFRPVALGWQELPEEIANLREQLPAGVGAWIGLLASLLLSAAACFLANDAGRPGFGLMLILGAGALSLGLGWLRLRRALLHGDLA